MPILFDTRTNTYYEPSLENLKQLAKMRPKMVAGMRGVYGSITPNLLVVPKAGTIYVYNGSWISDAFTTTNVRAGQSIGITTGIEAQKGWGIYGYLCVEVLLQVQVGGDKIGSKVFIEKTGVNLVASSGGGGGGGDVNFPIRAGSKNAAVAEFQTWLKNCGYNLGSWGVDGDWGGATTLGASAEGIIVINSRAQLDEILKTPCKRTGGGVKPDPIDNKDKPKEKEETPAGASDNTMLYAVGALGGVLLLKKFMGGKKKKKSKKR